VIKNICINESKPKLATCFCKQAVGIQLHQNIETNEQTELYSPLGYG